MGNIIHFIFSYTRKILHGTYMVICIFAAVCQFFLPVFVNAENNTQQAVIKDIVLTNSTSDVLLFGTLENSFTDEMIQGLKSGVPIQFSFYIHLEPEDKNNTSGTDTVSFTFSHILTYDTLKESYKVELQEKTGPPFNSQSLSDTQEYMNELNGIKIIGLSALVPEKKYMLKLRAEMHKKTLPMGLSKVTPFLSWWDQETDWYEIQFSY